MKKSELLKLSKEELVDLIEAYSKLYTTLDGLWFLTVEKEYGHEVASKMDVEVWSSMTPREAKRIREARELDERGIDTIIEALKYRPTFFTKEYDVIKGENTATVRVTECRSLHAMERDGRQVTSCMKILEKVYPNFVKSIDNRAKFRVLKAPPRKSTDDICCEWEVEIQ